MSPPLSTDCLLCGGHNRDPDRNLQFCSQRCTDRAMAEAEECGPQLIKVPRGHVIWDRIGRQFFYGWENSRPPFIRKLFLITSPPEMRESFESYRAFVKHVRKIRLPAVETETKLWRSERRACKLGEGNHQQLCSLPLGKCRLCSAIRTGFEYSLETKRKAVRKGSDIGVRYGAGLYMTDSPTKAYQYAENKGNGSEYKAVLLTRAVLGVPELMFHEDHTKVKPSSGYDSVESCIPGKATETIVYHEDAARPAYLLILT